MTSGHISLFWVLGCRRFWNRVENSRSKMSEPSGPCSDVEGTVKVDILKFPKGIGKPPNRPSGRRRFCAVQAFWPKAKTLAQGNFISPEHVKSLSVSIKITTPDGVVIFMEHRNTIDTSFQTCI